MVTINSREMERIVKGYASRRRLGVLELLNRKPELSIEEIAKILKLDSKNVSAHVQKMAIANLVMKRSDGQNIRHKLTKRGSQVCKFLASLE